MFTFRQFIALIEAKDIYGHDYFDSWHDGRNIKGWMSPAGKPHEFSTHEEHRHNHHPDYIKSGGKQGDSIQDAQKKGFVRYGQSSFGGSMHGSHYFVHFDAKHPQGHSTAIKAIKHLDPPHYAPVAVSGSAGVFRNGRRNARAIKDLSSEKVMTPSQALLHLRNKGKIEEGAYKQRQSERSTNTSGWLQQKGWMTPKGNAHIFNPDTHHASNLHPAIQDQHPDKKGAVGFAQSIHGHARFGQFGGSHYIHYDAKAPGGTKAALHALDHLNPHSGHEVCISHIPWSDKNLQNYGDKSFSDVEAAKKHIRKMHRVSKLTESCFSREHIGWISPKGIERSNKTDSEYHEDLLPSKLKPASTSLHDYGKAFHAGYVRFSNNKHKSMFNHDAVHGDEKKYHTALTNMQNHLNTHPYHLNSSVLLDIRDHKGNNHFHHEEDAEAAHKRLEWLKNRSKAGNHAPTRSDYWDEE